MRSWNWIKYGFGSNYSDSYVPFHSKNHTFLEKCLHIDYTNVGAYVKKDILDAGAEAVEKIVRNYPEPYTLMMSGGVDSQCMLHLWLNSGKKFKTKTYAYNYFYNHHDISNLLEIINQLKIKIDFESIDALEFFETELFEYAKKYHCTSPQICLYIKMAKQIKEGTVIFGGNFIQDCGTPINYTLLGLHRYQMIDNANIVPFFLTSTPELAYSFKEKYDENYNTLRESRTPNISYETKVKTLQDLKMPIFPQNIKYSGFEEIKNYYDAFYPVDAELKQKYNNYENNESRRSFDMRLRYQLEELMPYSNKVFSKVINLNPQINPENSSNFGFSGAYSNKLNQTIFTQKNRLDEARETRQKSIFYL